MTTLVFLQLIMQASIILNLIGVNTQSFESSDIPSLIKPGQDLFHGRNVSLVAKNWIKLDTAYI